MQLSANFRQADLHPMESGRIKALALDLDGTLLGPGAVLSDRAIRAVKRCMERGLRIIINTGRSIEGAEPYRVSLCAEGPMIYFNGAVVAEMPGALILNSTLLDKNTVEFCAEVSRKTGLYFQAYFPGSAGHKETLLLAEEDKPERDLYHRNTGILAELGDLRKVLNSSPEECCMKVMFIAEPEKLDEIRPVLERRLGNSVYMTNTQSNYLELMNAKVSKGQGLKFVMQRFSLKKDEVIAFGDNENDIPMLEAAGFLVAPSNSKDSVKARANAITGSNADDGVAIFLEDFFALNN